MYTAAHGRRQEHAKEGEKKKRKEEKKKGEKRKKRKTHSRTHTYLTYSTHTPATHTYTQAVNPGSQNNNVEKSSSNLAPHKTTVGQ